MNIIVNPKIYEQYRRVIRHSSARIVDGVLQREESVVHVVARKCRPLEIDGLAQTIRARNFQ